MTSPIPDRTLRLECFLDVYSKLSADNLETLKTIYSADILFTDPVHTINGLSSLTKYFQGLYSGSTFITFDFKETESSGETAFVRWEMAFSHLRLNHGEKISVPGVTFLVFAKDGKVERHQDYFDLGAMLYEHVPLLGRLISGIKKRLAS